MRVRDPLWHDGRFGGDTFANRVTLAIEEHGVFGSEAIDSADNFDALSGADKTALIAFLDSLGRIEFDGDGDGVIDIVDFLSFADCMGNGPYTADDPCAVHDLDQDGDVDLDDFDGFLLAYDGDLEDCNNNGTPDFVDILTGASPDLNGDGQADDCCPGDFDNSGAVDFNDIVSHCSTAWGTVPRLCARIWTATMTSSASTTSSRCIILSNWSVSLDPALNPELSTPVADRERRAGLPPHTHQRFRVRGSHGNRFLGRRRSSMKSSDRTGHFADLQRDCPGGCSEWPAGWVELHANETEYPHAARRSTRRPSPRADVEEKDYAWADFDGDGDIDLVNVRKQPFTSTGKEAPTSCS